MWLLATNALAEVWELVPLSRVAQALPFGSMLPHPLGRAYLLSSSLSLGTAARCINLSWSVIRGGERNQVGGDPHATPPIQELVALCHLVHGNCCCCCCSGIEFAEAAVRVPHVSTFHAHHWWALHTYEMGCYACAACFGLVKCIGDVRASAQCPSCVPIGGTD